MRLSTVILTKNEEKNIKRALESVKFSDEVIIIDDFSSDKTTSIASRLRAKVYKKRLNGNFGAQRNFGLQKSRGDWILFLDADEYLSSELIREIKKVVANGKKDAYYIKRRDYIWGREVKYGELFEVRMQGLIRLVRKDSGEWSSPVHETFRTSGRVGKLRGWLNHTPHQSVKEFVNDVNFYSTLRAKELHSQGKEPSLFEIVFWPPLKFIRNYLINLGFLDGPAGFLYSFMMSFHSFLVRAKLYQYSKLKVK